MLRYFSVVSTPPELIRTTVHGVIPANRIASRTRAMIATSVTSKGNSTAARRNVMSGAQITSITQIPRLRNIAAKSSGKSRTWLAFVRMADERRRRARTPHGTTRSRNAAACALASRTCACVVGRSPLSVTDPVSPTGTLPIDATNWTTGSRLLERAVALTERHDVRQPFAVYRLGRASPAGRFCKRAFGRRTLTHMAPPQNAATINASIASAATCPRCRRKFKTKKKQTPNAIVDTSARLRDTCRPRCQLIPRTAPAYPRTLHSHLARLTVIGQNRSLRGGCGISARRWCGPPGSWRRRGGLGSPAGRRG